MRDLRVSPGDPSGDSALTPDVALVVFDLAGTTIKDSTTSHRRSSLPWQSKISGSARMTLQPSGVHQSARRSPGSSLKDQIARDEPAPPMQRFENTLARLIVRTGCRRLTGRSHCFDICARRFIRVALNTGFERDIAEAILNDLRWDGEVIDAVVCGDDVSLGRPAPFLIFRAMERTNVQSVHQVVNVGDTTLDLRAGHNAGVR